MNDLVTDAQRLFLKGLNLQDECAAAIFSWASGRKRDASLTTIERLSSLTNWEEWDIRRVAKLLEAEGFCRFIAGRKGYKSRIEWYYSIKSMAKVALGESVELLEIGPDVLDEDDEPKPSVAFSELTALTIPQAKKAIALSLGIDPEQIEISIKA